MIIICDNCSSLIAYGPSDIQPIPSINAKGFVCPLCRAYIKTDLQGDVDD